MNDIHIQTAQIDRDAYLDNGETRRVMLQDRPDRRDEAVRLADAKVRLVIQISLDVERQMPNKKQ